MLKARSVPIKFWAEAINMAYYIHNRVYHRSRTQMTPNEIWKGKKPNMKHLHKFGCPCYILNDREQRGKFNAKSDEGVFLGYSSNSRTYRVYNKRTMAIMESINVKVDDHLPQSNCPRLEDSPIIPTPDRFNLGEGQAFSVSKDV